MNSSSAIAEKPDHESASTTNEKPSVIVQQGRNGSDSFKNYVLWGILGTAAVGTIMYFGYRFVKNKISDFANNGSLDNNNPSYYAKQMKMGIDNNNVPGTDTNTIRQAFVAIPSKEYFRKVESSYQKQYGTNLYKDLEEHLKTTEFQEMSAIYRIKPEREGKNAQPIYDPYAWAQRINNAVNYETWGFLWGTDLEAIKQVVREVPTQKAWQDVKDAYQEKYSVSMEDDLDGDVSQGDYDFRAEVAKKPSE